ncbi:MAG: hypothetical protein QG665_342 [Patescibacteria group bacterium]|nr:hypothetical protein [Patescibacteria group bacterium]
MKSLITKLAILLAVFSLATPALATIQDQARANRESFLRLQKEPQAEVPGNATSTESRLRSLDDRVNEIKEQAILINYNRIIAKLEVYNTYLGNVNTRLGAKIDADKLAGIDTEEASGYVVSAGLDLAEASTTIALAKASSTEVFLNDNPVEALSVIKERLAKSSTLLQGAREKIVLAINSLKTDK